MMIEGLIMTNQTQSMGETANSSSQTNYSTSSFPFSH